MEGTSLMDTNSNLVYPGKGMRLHNGTLVQGDIAVSPGIPSLFLTMQIEDALAPGRAAREECDIDTLKVYPQRSPVTGQDHVYLEVVFNSGPKMRKNIYNDLVLPYLHKQPVGRYLFVVKDFLTHVTSQLRAEFADK